MIGYKPHIVSNLVVYEMEFLKSDWSLHSVLGVKSNTWINLFGLWNVMTRTCESLCDNFEMFRDQIIQYIDFQGSCCTSVNDRRLRNG